MYRYRKIAFSFAPKSPKGDFKTYLCNPPLGGMGGKTSDKGNSLRN
jgi:hypothetical protein